MEQEVVKEDLEIINNDQNAARGNLTLNTSSPVAVFMHLQKKTQRGKGVEDT